MLLTNLINCDQSDQNQTYLAACTNEIMTKMW